MANEPVLAYRIETEEYIFEQFLEA